MPSRFPATVGRFPPATIQGAGGTRKVARTLLQLTPIVSGSAASAQQIEDESPRNGSSGLVTVRASIDPPCPKPGGGHNTDFAATRELRLIALVAGHDR